VDTNESKAALKLQIAETAMRNAAAALDAVGSEEAILHAKEMRWSVNRVRTWELELRKMHAAGAG